MSYRDIQVVIEENKDWYVVNAVSSGNEILYNDYIKSECAYIWI